MDFCWHQLPRSHLARDVPQVPPDLAGLLVPRDFLDLKGMLGNPVEMVRLELLALRAHLGQEDHLENLVLGVHLGPQERFSSVLRLDLLDPLGHLDHKVHKDLLVSMDNLARKDRLENLATRENPDPMAFLVTMVHLGHVVLLVQTVTAIIAPDLVSQPLTVLEAMTRIRKHILHLN